MTIWLGVDVGIAAGLAHGGPGESMHPRHDLLRVFHKVQADSCRGPDAVDPIPRPAVEGGRMAKTALGASTKVRFTRAYDRWNEAIAATLFAEANDGKPVYLDMSDEALAEAAEAAGLPDAGRDELQGAVREVLGPVKPGKNIFAWPKRVTRSWVRSGRAATPPFLALLASFVLAAEDMRSSDGYAAHNYYARLARVLGIDESVERDYHHLQSNFRDDSLLFWGELNSWLESCDGARGLPTAYAFDDRRYVGVPISQALIRSADREKLRGEFFVLNDFYPGASVAVDDMMRLLEDWLPASSVSSVLKRLWASTSGARERIASVVVLELAVWDGGVVTEGAGTSRLPGRLHLAAQEIGVPRYRLRFAVLLRGAASPPGPYGLQKGAPKALADLLQSCGGSLCARESGLDGWLLLEEAGLDCVGSLLSGALALEHVESGSLVSRSVKRLTVLQFDELTGLYIEVEHVQLGKPCLLLVRDSLWAAQEAEIRRVLREGFAVHPAGSVPGLEAHWVLVSGAEVVDLVDQQLSDNVLFDLGSLVPVSWTQLTLTGGLCLPGRSTWHVDAPPEVIATSVVADKFVVTVEAEGGLGEIFSGDVSVPFEDVGVVSLADLKLPGGDYVVELHGGTRKGKVLTQTRLRLRSSDSMRPQHLPEAEWVGHLLEAGPATLISAVRCKQAPREPAARGVLVSNLKVESPATAARGSLPLDFEGVDHGRWPDVIESGFDDDAARPGPELGVPSCLLRGAHHFVFPPCVGGAHHQKRWTAACKYCGAKLVIDRSRTRRRRPGGGVSHGVAPRVIAPPRERRWVPSEVLIDAVFCASGWSWQAFERLARQVDDSPLFAWEYARRLSSLGYVEEVLDKECRPEWVAASPGALVRLGDATLVTGRVGRSAIRDLAVAAAAADARYTCECDDEGVPVRRLACAGEEVMEEVRGLVSEIAELPVVEGLETALTMLAAMPRFADVADVLGVKGMPRTRGLRRFDFATNKWVDWERDDVPGAYATRSFTTTYGLRRPDTPAGQFLVADAATVKYLAALDCGAQIDLVLAGSERACLSARRSVAPVDRACRAAWHGSGPQQVQGRHAALSRSRRATRSCGVAAHQPRGRVTEDGRARATLTLQSAQGRLPPLLRHRVLATRR